MENLIKKVEVLANIAIILVACLLGIVLIRNHLFTDSSNCVVKAPVENQLSPGNKLSSPAVDWGKSKQTLVLALSNTCHFCTESASFYQKLAQSKGDARLIAVLPQPVEDGQKYLEKLGVSVDEVKQSSLDKLGVSGTPTLLLIDDSGTVKALWVGKLLPEQETAVLDAVRNTRMSFVPSLRKADLQFIN
jgi:hypothetical protein